MALFESPIHDAIVLVLVVAFWILPSFLIARFAERKGRSFGGWLIAALFLGWLLVGLLVAVLPARRESAADEPPGQA
jgi:hypothetical protein